MCPGAPGLKANVLELDQDRLVVGRIGVVRRIKQRRLRPDSAIQSATELRPAVLLALLEFAEVGHHPVSRALGRANRFDQRPVRVSFAVLASLEPLEKHHIPAAELRSLCNKNDKKTCPDNRVGRDSMAFLTRKPCSRFPGRDPDPKKTELWSEVFNLG